MSEVEEATPSNAAKRLARLVAVQALYQSNFAEEPLGEILQRSLEETDAILNSEEDENRIKERPDAELVRDIARGTTANLSSLEEMLAGVLDQRFSSGRMEILLKMILCAGAYELHHHGNIDSAIIISDYVDVTHAFFNGKEPGLVNAVLDKLASKLRG